MEKKYKWISVKEALPYQWDRVAVLLLTDKTEPRISHIDKRNYFDANGETFTKRIWVGVSEQVTHWCPLPDFPDKKTRLKKNTL